MWGGPSEPFYKDEKSPETPSDYVKLADEAYAFLMALYASDGWTEAPAGPNVKFWEKKLEGFDIPMMRMEGELNASPKEAFEFHEYAPIEVKRKWDRLLDQIESLEKPIDGVEVVHMTFKSIFPISRRDVVAFKAYKTLPDGTHVGFGHTINHKACPIGGSFVRAKGKMLNMFCPVPGHPFKTKFKRIVLLDPMGSIPGWVIAKVQKEVTKIFDIIDGLLIEKYGENRVPPIEVASAPSALTLTPKYTDSEGDEFYDTLEDFLLETPASLHLHTSSSSSSRDAMPLAISSTGIPVAGLHSESLFHSGPNGHSEDRHGAIVQQSMVKLIAELQRATNLLEERLKQVENKSASSSSRISRPGGFLQSIIRLIFGSGSPWITLRTFVVWLGWPIVAIALYHFFVIRRRYFR